MFDKNEIINVYNENEGKIYAVATFNDRGHVFEAMEDGEPTITPLPFSEIEFINNRSRIFKEGRLRFDPEIEEDIYKQLRITPNNNYLADDEIKDIIINANADKLEKILKVNSMGTIEKVRNMLVKLDNEAEYDIAMRVYEVVNARYNEINKGNVKSKLIIKRVKNEKVDIPKVENKPTPAEDKNVTEKVEKSTVKKSTKSKK